MPAFLYSLLNHLIPLQQDEILKCGGVVVACIVYTVYLLQFKSQEQEGNENSRVRTAKNLLLHKSSEKTGKNFQSQLVGPKLSPLADLEALHKQEVKTQAELSTTWLSVGGVPQNSYRVPQQRPGDLTGSRCMRKSLFSCQLTTRQKLQWPHTVKNTGFTELV